MFLSGCPSCTILGLKPTACLILVFSLNRIQINQRYAHNQRKPNKQTNHAIQVVTIHLVATRCHVNHVTVDPMLRTSPRLHHRQPPTTGWIALTLLRSPPHTQFHRQNVLLESCWLDVCLQFCPSISPWLTFEIQLQPLPRRRRPFGPQVPQGRPPCCRWAPWSNGPEVRQVGGSLDCFIPAQTLWIVDVGLEIWLTCSATERPAGWTRVPCSG